MEWRDGGGTLLYLMTVVTSYIAGSSYSVLMGVSLKTCNVLTNFFSIADL